MSAADRPADGAPSREAEQHVAEAKSFGYSPDPWAVEIVALRSALRAVERERDAKIESITRGLRHAMKAYQRRVPCSCHECRRDAGATDGVGTNGGCQHSALRSLLRALSPGAATTESEGTHG